MPALTAVVALLVVTLLSSQQTPAATDPGPRTGHCLVEAGDGGVYLLGGQLWRNAPPDARSELWQRTPEGWRPVAGSATEERYLHGAVFDPHAGRVLSFWNAADGSGERMLAWDGRQWQPSPGDGAVPLHYGLAWDDRRRQVIRFGGTHAEAATGWPRTTSRLVDGKWQFAANDGPQGRGLNCSSLVYDRERAVVVMFGGVGQPAAQGPQPLFGDTWTWDGTSWTRVAASGPSPRAAHALAFDRRAGVVLLYGGGTLEQGYGDMWRWDGRSWSEIRLSGPTPGPRRGHAMAFDAARGRVVLYGGESAGTLKNDTWEWDGHSWAVAQ